MSAKQYGTLGIVGVAGYLLANIALHFLDPNLSIVNTHLSDYALGDYGWLSRASDFSAAVGLIAIALGLRLTLAPGKRVIASWVLIFIAGVGFIVSGLFVTDGSEATEFTAEGVVHVISFFVTAPALVISAWLLRGVFLRDDGYKHLARTQRWFAILITVALAVGMMEVAVGLTQRVLVAVLVSWWFVLAANVRRSDMPRHLSEHETRT